MGASSPEREQRTVILVDRMSPVCPDVAELWGSAEMQMRTAPTATGRVEASAMLEPWFQPMEHRFRALVLDALPGAMQRMAMKAGLAGVCQLIFSAFVEAGPGPGAERTDLDASSMSGWPEQ